MSRRRGSGLRAGNSCRDSTTDVARMILKPRRKNTKSPDGGETLGAVEDGTWEERPTVFEQ